MNIIPMNYTINSCYHEKALKTSNSPMKLPMKIVLWEFHGVYHIMKYI